MIVAALGAAGLGWWKHEYELIIDGAVLILIFAISGALEGYAMARTERNIRSLMSLTPEVARALVGGKEEQTPIAKLRVGDMLLVKPGELIPTDALIVEGSSSINQAAITGESLPIDKTVGDEVFGGTVNGNGVLTLRVHQPPASSLIQRIITLVKQAQTETPASQAFIEKIRAQFCQGNRHCWVIIRHVTPFSVALGLGNYHLSRLIFLVVASPCA